MFSQFIIHNFIHLLQRIGSCITKTNSTTDLNSQRTASYSPLDIQTSHTLPKQQQNVFASKSIEIEQTTTTIDGRKFNDESHLSFVDTYRTGNSSTPNRPPATPTPPPPPKRSPHIISHEKVNQMQRQLNDSAIRMRDLEVQIKQVPRLQLELTNEKAENRDLLTKLKQMEEIVAKLKREKLSTPSAPPSTKTEAATSPLKPFSPQRVCAMSLESLNFRFPTTSSPTNSVQSNPSLSLHNFSSTSASHLQRNVACMTQSPLTRDIGVVTLTPERKSMRSTASNTDSTTKASAAVHNVAIQCVIDEGPKREFRNASTSTPRPVTPPPEPVVAVVTHSIGVMATPHVRDNQCTARPEVKSIGTENIYRKVRTRDHGTDPIVELNVAVNVPTVDLSSTYASISLKSLDLLSSATSMVPPMADEKPSKTTPTASIGIQHTPDVLSTGSQCIIERPITPPPTPPPSAPKVHTQTISTDTCDLLLLRHRGVNTDAPVAKRDRLTNTEPVRTTHESTNTTPVRANPTCDTGTSPDQNTIGDDALHQCHSCLAKIEIKQQTIITNKTTKSDRQLHQANVQAATIIQAAEDVQTKEADASSRIPRPTALISTRPDRKFNRQNTYTVASPVSLSPTQPSSTTSPAIICPAEAYLR